MKTIISSAMLLCFMFTGAMAKEKEKKTPKVPRGTFHLNDLEKAKEEAVKKKLPLCFVVT